ncbi:WEB family protein [Rhynchospora pubera]|uniref:WEB family protein n=1 Tax=Rhynchospora pubera TaxID=906938 RepID=A0AAV8DSV9_9POAL|nr:WEB family protein [Rhynchospora pubera]
MEGEKNSVVIEDRVIIDTSAPFRSVKEAVVLFGERIMASQVKASWLSKMECSRENERCHSSRLDSIAIQLKETRQDVRREKEKCVQMAKHILTLEDELESTRREIKELKDNRSCSSVNPTKLETQNSKFIDRKKRHVTFADPLFGEIVNIIVGKN